MADPFGRALLAHHRGEREQPLLQRDGDDVLEHPIEEFYFGDPDREWLTSTFEPPTLDVGAGAGRDALALQERGETVAIEVSESLVTLLAERGVEDARLVDMFDLRERFEPDRFRSVLVIGTQVGLAGSMAGLEGFLADLAAVTTDDATAVLDWYDPTHPGATELLGYREDAASGLAHRVMYFEYGGTVGPILLFRLFSPERVREAARETDWSVETIDDESFEGPYYRVRLRKRNREPVR